MSRRPRPWREVYPPHPAADVFPMLSDAELDELGADIKANGLRAPLLLWQPGSDDPLGPAPGPWYLLDGRNRLEAMQRTGLAIPDTGRRIGPNGLPEQAIVYQQGHTWVSSDDGGWKKVAGLDPAATVIALNIHRRHLTPAQRARLAAKVITAAERFGGNVPDKPRPRGRPTSAATKIAEAAQVDPKTARDQQAVAADPDLDAKVDAGEMTPEQAGRVVRERRAPRPKGIAPGDIVEVDKKGRRFHALVGGMDQGASGQYELSVVPLARGISYRTATTREVVTVWRKVRS